LPPECIVLSKHHYVVTE